jgi:hypothetical protein
MRDILSAYAILLDWETVRRELAASFRALFKNGF